MSLSLKNRSVALLEGYSKNAELVEIREYHIFNQTKKVDTLVFRFERYE